MIRENLSCHFKIISNIATIIFYIYDYTNLKFTYFNHKHSNNHNYLFQLSKRTISIK
jgi:hypothetical protein